MLRNKNIILKDAFFCGSNLGEQLIIDDIKFMTAVLKYLDPVNRTLVLTWVGKGGIFWEKEREDNNDDYFDFDSRDVTDYGIGECSRRILVGKEVSLVSLIGNSVIFRDANLVVTHGLPESPIAEVSINNITSHVLLEQSALSVVPKPTSWAKAIAKFQEDFKGLVISDCVEEQLSSQPFGVCPYTRIEELLNVLQSFIDSRDPNGEYTDKTKEIIREFFSGEKAWFSDESTTNKRDFKSKLTFNDPLDATKKIFCSFHGKVKSPQLRVHFCLPSADEKIIKICYIGPKITKK